MLNRWTLVQVVTAGAVLSLAASAAHAEAPEDQGPTDPVSVSDNASEQAQTNAEQGMDQANEARGTEEEETEYIYDTSDSDSDLLL